MKNATKFSLFLRNLLSKVKFPKTGVMENFSPLELWGDKWGIPGQIILGNIVFSILPHTFTFINHIN